MDDNQALDDKANRYVWWCRTRKHLGPPRTKINILARLQPSRLSNIEPDGFLDANMPFFNMAVHALCDSPEYESEASCFVGVYWYETNIKAIARDQGCARGTVYNRARKFVQLANGLSKVIKEAHESHTCPKCSNSIEQNSAIVD